MKCMIIFILIISFVYGRKTQRKRSAFLVENSRNADVNKSFNVHANEADENNLKLKAAEELRLMFGFNISVREPNKPQIKKKPPKYMVDLYKAVTDQEYQTRPAYLMIADTVRSIHNGDPLCPDFCHFNLHRLKENEVVTDAELHIFVEKPQKQAQEKSFILKIFDVTEVAHRNEKNLIAARRLPYNKHGWEIFPLLDTVKKLFKSKKQNLNVSIETSRSKLLAFDKRPISPGRQPIVVTFSKDDYETTDYVKQHADHPSLISTSILHTRKLPNNRIGREFRHRRDVEPEIFDDIQADQKENWNKKKISGNLNKDKKTENSNTEAFSSYNEKNKSLLQVDKRPSRDNDMTRFPTISMLSDPNSPSKVCNRYPLYINFEEMGWSEQIIYPKGYNAYYCKGECFFPLVKRLRSSNHATVQSIMHAFGLGKDPVTQPCCVPNVLYSQNILFFDQDEYVVLRNYKDMVAGSCACT